MQVLSSITDRWPAFVHPKRDELLSSWIVRTAHAHGTKVHTFGKLVWPGSPIWNRDIDRIAAPVIWETMARKAGISPERGYTTTLTPYQANLMGTSQRSSHISWVMPLGIYHRTHRNYGLVYCPSCLKNDRQTPYYRRSWRLAFWLVCPSCGIYMHECCPICQEPINFFRIELGRKNADPDRPISTCSHCGYDLTQAPQTLATPKTLRRFRSLYRISREGWNRQVQYPHLYFTVLRQLLRVLGSPDQRAKFIQQDMRIRFGHLTDLNTYSGSFEGMSMSQRTCLINEAMWLLDDWPNRFIAVMSYHRLGSSMILKDMPDDVPFWFSSVISEHFHFTNINRRFKPADSSRFKSPKDQIIAPIKGFVGGPRKYDPNRNCPQCSSNWISHNGFRAQRQRYICRECGRNMTE